MISRNETIFEESLFLSAKNTNYSVSQDTETEVEPAFAYTAAVLLIVAETFGIAGIVLVIIWFMLITRKRLTTTHLCLISLFINDAIFKLFTTNFTIISYLALRWPFANSLCKIVLFAELVLRASSIDHIALFSLYRSWVIFGKGTRTRTGRAILMIVIMTLCRIIPFSIFSYNKDPAAVAMYEPTLMRCIIRCDDLVARAMMAFNVGVPAVVVVGSYIFSWILIRNKLIMIKPAHRGEWLRRQVHVLKIFGAVFLIYASGWYPYIIVQLCTCVRRYPYTFFVLTCLLHMSNCFTSYVLCVMDVEIKDSVIANCWYFWRRLSCCSNCIQNRSTHSQRRSFSMRSHKGPITLTKDTEVIRCLHKSKAGQHPISEPSDTTYNITTDDTSKTPSSEKPAEQEDTPTESTDWSEQTPDMN